MAVPERCRGSLAPGSDDLDTGPGTTRSSRKRRDSAGSDPGLRHQRATLPGVSSLLSTVSATDARHVGKERLDLSAGRAAPLQAECTPAGVTPARTRRLAPQ